MQTINRGRLQDSPFTAGMGEAVVQLYAVNERHARQLAVEHFRPKKKDIASVWIKTGGVK